MLPLACQADGGHLLGPSVWDGMIASRQAMESKQKRAAEIVTQPKPPTTEQLLRRALLRQERAAADVARKQFSDDFRAHQRR